MFGLKECIDAITENVNQLTDSYTKETTIKIEIKSTYLKSLFDYQAYFKLQNAFPDSQNFCVMLQNKLKVSYVEALFI